MKSKNKQDKADWSKGRRRRAIVEQRKYLWYPEAIEKYASWLGLKPGMTAIDVGCGLGYLGYTYWPYFGKGGRYIGVDKSEKLLKDAEKGAKVWARGGKAEFKMGDAYKLPFEGGFGDWVMCQTLLMHLEKPKEALKEMIRVLKPGGLFMCKEPDNLSAGLSRQFFSAYEFSHDDFILQAKINLTLHEGRKKLGRGDQSIGNKIPHMLSELGMRGIDIRMNERVHFLEPPYESEEQKQLLKILIKQHTNEKDKKYWIEQGREEFKAGGGNLADYDRWIEIMDKFLAAARKQYKDGTFACCTGSYFYIIKARKPR
jgi:ubiquinone/menaquinone biosynthesis C-methylase UbiE